MGVAAVRVWLVVAVFGANLLLSPFVLAAEGALGPAPPLLPVILIHGAGATPEVWGVPAGRGRGGGFYRFLTARGYTPGQTLFWLDYADHADGDYAAIARERLAPLVERVLAQSGAPRVDLVAHGMGCLVARHYLTAMGGDGKVRTLAMLAPPNHGLRLASLYRLAGTLVEQEGLRRESGQGRGEAWDPEAPRGPFVSETSYVNRLARDYFEPLYGDYVRRELFARRTTGRALPDAFERWFASRHPAEFNDLFTAAVRPPLDQGAGAGAVLTRAYFHHLALAVARHNYRRFAPWTEVAARGWRGDVQPSRDLRRTLLEFLAGRLMELGGEALRRLGASAALRTVLAGGERLSGLSFRSEAVARLVSERVQVLGDAGDGGAVLANFGLARLNAAEGARLAARTTRYVTVAPALPPPLDDPALLAPGPLDVYRVESGLRRGGTGAFLRDPRIQAFVWGHLDPLRGAAASGRPEGGGRVPPAAPFLLSAEVPGVAGASLAAEVRPEGEPSPGERLQAFFAVARGGVIRRVQPLGAAAPGGILGGALDPAGIDPRLDRVFLGVRLSPPGEAAPPLSRLRADIPQRFRYALRVEGEAPPAAAGTGGGAAAEAGGGAGSGAAPARPRLGGAAAGPGTAAPGGSRGVAGGGRGPERRSEGGRLEARPGGPPVGERDRNDRGVPRIDVVYRNKRTTDKVEDRTHHVRWEWDFGDGTTWVDDDPDHVVSEASHSFAPGNYTVRARSFSNKGTLLREITWEVIVVPPREEVDFVAGEGDPVGAAPSPGRRTFRAETVREPVPRLVLEGPVKWVTGRPGRFRLEAVVPAVPFVESVRVTYHPAKVFDVQWARPGIFRVQGAVVLRITYRLPEGRLVLTNTYVTERRVDVLATSVTG